MTTPWSHYAAGGMMNLPAPPALAGVWAKMGRATDHQRALDEAVATYLAIPPYRVTETRSDASVVVRAEVTQLPPVTLGLILGDLIYNARSALDHLAYQFARLGEPGPTIQTQYPIRNTEPQDFAALQAVAGMPAEVVAIMADMQPYQPEANTVGWFLGRELAQLQLLSNRDKHRLLLVTERLVVPTFVESTTPEGTESEVGFLVGSDQQWAEVRYPAVDGNGLYQVHFEAKVVLLGPEVEQAQDLSSVASRMVHGTEAVIAAFRGQWDLLRDLDGMAGPGD